MSERMWSLVCMAAWVGGLLVSGGCSDWPHLDYAPSALRTVQEMEADGAEGVQNLDQLHGNVLVQGRIDTGAYVTTTDREAPFDLPGWYTGDMDWFQFNLRDPEDIRLRLTWDTATGVLDLYFFEASSNTGELTLLDYEADDQGPLRELLETDLIPGTIYVVAVAGHTGDAVSYNLLLELVE